MSARQSFTLPLKITSQQECIPVGCIPPACCPYLPACTARGVPGPGGCTWSREVPGLGGVPGLGRVPGLSGVPGPGGVPAQVLPPVDRILDTRF